MSSTVNGVNIFTVCFALAPWPLKIFSVFFFLRRCSSHKRTCEVKISYLSSRIVVCTKIENLFYAAARFDTVIAFRSFRPLWQPARIFPFYCTKIRVHTRARGVYSGLCFPVYLGVKRPKDALQIYSESGRFIRRARARARVFDPVQIPHRLFYVLCIVKMKHSACSRRAYQRSETSEVGCVSVAGQSACTTL